MYMLLETIQKGYPTVISLLFDSSTVGGNPPEVTFIFQRRTRRIQQRRRVQYEYDVTNRSKQYNLEARSQLRNPHFDGMPREAARQTVETQIAVLGEQSDKVSRLGRSQALSKTMRFLLFHTIQWISSTRVCRTSGA
jgi:hypothetical protein